MTSEHAQTASIREWSKAAFGNAYFVEVLRELSRADRVSNVREVAAELRIVDSVVRSVFLRLVKAGALERVPMVGGTVSYFIEPKRFSLFLGAIPVEIAGPVETADGSEVQTDSSVS